MDEQKFKLAQHIYGRAALVRHQAEDARRRLITQSKRCEHYAADAATQFEAGYNGSTVDFLVAAAETLIREKTEWEGHVREWMSLKYTASLLDFKVPEGQVYPFTGTFAPFSWEQEVEAK